MESRHDALDSRIEVKSTSGAAVTMERNDAGSVSSMIAGNPNNEKKLLW